MKLNQYEADLLTLGTVRIALQQANEHRKLDTAALSGHKCLLSLAVIDDSLEALEALRKRLKSERGKYVA